MTIHELPRDHLGGERLRLGPAAEAQPQRGGTPVEIAAEVETLTKVLRIALRCCGHALYLTAALATAALVTAALAPAALAPGEGARPLDLHQWK